MQKWEYLYVEVKLDAKYIEKILTDGFLTYDLKGMNKGEKMIELHQHYNKLGDEGWELISVHIGGGNTQSHIFKRPKE